MKPKEIFHYSLCIFLLGFSHNVLSQSAGWTIAAPDVWKLVIGIPDKLDLLNTAEIKPSIEALAKMGNAEFPFAEKKIVTNVTNGKTYLQLPLVKDEQIYGFGLNFKTVQQRGKILQLHVDHYGGTDNGRTHAPSRLPRGDEAIHNYNL